MAFQIGDPHDVASYNAYQSTNSTFSIDYSGGASYSKLFFTKTTGIDNLIVRNTAFGTVLPDEERSQVLITLKDSVGTTLFTIRNEVQPFEFIVTNPGAVSYTAVQGDSGRKYYEVLFNLGQGEFTIETIKNFNNPFAADPNMKVTLYQGDNTMTVGQKIRAYDVDFNAFLAEGLTELTLEFGQTGRLGGEDIV